MTSTDNIRLSHWLDFIESLPDDPWQALGLIHAWTLDTVVYRHEPPSLNYWQCPQETLASGTGDCEDLAILFYAAVRLWGVPAHKVRLAHVVGARGEHMVCLVRLDSGEVMLDNLRPAPVVWGDFMGYQVVYMINEIDTWLPDHGHVPNHHRQWSRVLGQLAELHPTFIAEMEGA